MTALPAALVEGTIIVSMLPAELVRDWRWRLTDLVDGVHPDMRRRDA